MVGWHHRLDGHEWHRRLDGHDFEQAPGVGDGWGSLVCCSPWSRKETTEHLNWTVKYKTIAMDNLEIEKESLWCVLFCTECLMLIWMLGFNLKVLMLQNRWHPWWLGLHKELQDPGNDCLSLRVICLQKSPCKEMDVFYLSTWITYRQVLVICLWVFSTTTLLPTHGKHFLLFWSAPSLMGCHKQLAWIFLCLLMTFLMHWVSPWDQSENLLIYWKHKFIVAEMAKSLFFFLMNNQSPCWF